MNADANEERRVRLTSFVEICRAQYLRIEDAGDDVTARERAEARTTYQVALERLSRFLTDIGRPSSRSR
jgi:hypothetical protein